MIAVKRYDHAILALAALVLTLGAAPAAAQVMLKRAAWIDLANAATAVRVIRAGKEQAYDQAEGLLACDTVLLLERGAIVRVVLATGARIRLDAAQPTAAVPCDAPGVSARVGRLLAALRTHAESRRATVATMSRGAGSDSLRMPILFAPRAIVARNPDGDHQGRQLIHLAWQGGAGPFRAELRRADGILLAALDGISGHKASLAVMRWIPGHFALSVTSADGSGVREADFQAVAYSAIPPMPDALKRAALHPTARSLFYADYLLGYDDGRYAMQAMQQVAAIHPQSEATRTWLAFWGEGD